MKAYVYAPLPDDVHHFFPKDRGGDDESVPHCTVLFIGDISDENIPKLREILSSETGDMPPVKAKFGPVKHFPAGKDGVPWYVSIEAEPGLERLHKELWRKLEEAKVPVAHSWKDYVPHATLKYLPDGERYTDASPSGEFVIDKIELDLQ